MTGNPLRNTSLSVSTLALAAIFYALPAYAGPIEGGISGTLNWSAIGGFNQLYAQYPGDTVSAVPQFFTYPEWHMTMDTGSHITLDVALSSLSPVSLFINTGATLTNAFNGTTSFNKIPLYYNQGITNYGTVEVPVGNLDTRTFAPDYSLMNKAGGLITIDGTGTLTFNQGFLNEGTLTLAGANNSVIGAPGAGNVPFNPASLGNGGTIQGGGSLGTAGGVISVLNYAGLIVANAVDPLVVWTANCPFCGFANAGGEVRVELGSTLELHGGSYIQTSGLTKVHGTLDNGSALELQGGVLGGQGLVTGGVVVSGTGQIKPGDPQTLTFGGSFTMTGGSIYLTILGPNAVDQDHLIFNGLADLSGGTVFLDIPLGVDLNGLTLDLFTFNSDHPGSAPQFSFVNGQNYQVVQQGNLYQFSGNTVTGTPEPATFGLFAGALGLMAAVRRRKV